LGKTFNMKRKDYLRLSGWVLQFMRGLCVIALAFMLYDGIRHSIDPEYYFVRWEWYGLSGDMDFVEEGEYPPQTAASYYFNWIQISIQLVLMFLVWTQLIKVLNSVVSFETFISDNPIRFRKIGSLILGIFFMDLFHFFDGMASADTEIQVGANFSILFFALGAYVLAIVFEEGKRLAEEQKLIV